MWVGFLFFGTGWWMLNVPLQMLIVMLAGWVNEEHRAVNAYLKEENRVLRDLHGKKRLRFTDDQRRRLAVKGKPVGRRGLREFGSIVTPNTILRVASGADRPEVRRQPNARPWQTGDSGRNPFPRGTYGE